MSIFVKCSDMLKSLEAEYYREKYYNVNGKRLKVVVETFLTGKRITGYFEKLK